MAAEENTGGRERPPGLAARKFRGRPRHGTELGSTRTPHLAQARHVSQDPLPDQARHTPVLRANPYPEVTDPICRLPLPTLFYRLEALYLGDLLRIWVRTGRNSTWPSPEFSWSEGKIWTPPQLRCSSQSSPYLPARGFHG